MAGYVTKQQGYVYWGEHAAAEPLENGKFVELDAAGKVALTTGTNGLEMRVREKLVYWGLPFVRLEIMKVGTKNVMFSETDFGAHYEERTYDQRDYRCETDELPRIHPLLQGDEVFCSVEQTVYDLLTEGDTVDTAANGTVVKV
jgi:hypothetical protein